MPKFRRIFFIVTDGLGIGPEPRQEEFGDKVLIVFYMPQKFYH